LLADLLQEQLLVAADEQQLAAPPLERHGAGSRPPFQMPVVERYTDMADLLLLDPIHDVNAEGWPHPASGANG